jgi:flagellin
MALRINFNAESTVTHTALLQNERAMNKSLLRISTGNRILSAADDAAGLFIADQLSVVAAALEQGNRNIQTGISALQIAETNVGQIFDKLKTIYTKAQSAANDINDPNARSALQRDIANLVDAIQKIGTDTEYNGIKLLDGNFSDKVIHYGARADQTITVGINSVKANDLGAFMVTGSYSTTQATASAAAGTTVANGYTASTGAVTTGGAFRWDSGDKAVVAGIDVSGGLSFAVDAKKIADNINSSTNLQNAGISARASNTSTAAAEWTDIQVGTGQSLEINFL